MKGSPGIQFVVVLAAVIALNACAPTPRITVSERSVNYPKTKIIAVRLPPYYRVQAGDSLFSIAWTTGLDYSLLGKWNGLKRPWKIYPGQRLRLRKPVQPQRRRASKQQPTQRRIVSTAKKTIPRTQNTQNNRPVRRWLWPARGKVISRFNLSRGRKGIAIKGLKGSAVRAAAAGRVVYAGHGLRGYGNLVIIKHNASFLSAYAYNQVLLVKEGEQVRRGQQIAKMGRSGSNRTQLHFEVRKNGRPVDPLRLLPRRR